MIANAQEPSKSKCLNSVSCHCTKPSEWRQGVATARGKPVGFVAPAVSLLLYAFLVVFFWYPGRALSTTTDASKTDEESHDES